jgi:hypothetical protein
MDDRWKAALEEAAVSGSLASLCSAAALALAGRRETPSAAAPMNATSQWIWGQRESLQADQPDRRHTVTGYAVHHFAATFWATLHARALADREQAEQPLPALAAAAATAVVAAVVDFKLTPERFTPGFQHRVSTRALVAAYGCFALGLAAGSLAVRRWRRRRTEREHAA